VKDSCKISGFEELLLASDAARERSRRFVEEGRISWPKRDASESESGARVSTFQGAKTIHVECIE